MLNFHFVFLNYMLLSDFDYNLPPERIAQTPMEPRDHSRLMRLDRNDQSISHHYFYHLADLLTDQDVLVFNHSRVIPARIRFELKGKPAEILLLKPLMNGQWECLVRPGKWFKADDVIHVNDLLTVRVKQVKDFGERILEFECDDFEAYLKQKGEMPTPPYIHEKLQDPERYQTVYAKPEGSVAAPTAGLHFTPELLEKLKQKGVQQEFVTLNVGLGTFQPVKAEDPLEHTMHHEWFDLDEGAAERLNQAKAEGKRIIAVGTTTVRVLESCAERIDDMPPVGAKTFSRLRVQSGETNLFIYPGYHWKFVDSLITNFHVPKSTLLMLVSSFAEQPSSVGHSERSLRSEESPAEVKLTGRGFILKAYQEAIDENYRFFSFGDAMWIE